MNLHLDMIDWPTVLLILAFVALLVLIAIMLLRNERRPVKHIGPVFNARETRVVERVKEPPQVVEHIEQHYHVRDAVLTTFEFCTKCGLPLEDKSFPAHPVCPKSKPPSPPPPPAQRRDSAQTTSTRVDTRVEKSMSQQAPKPTDAGKAGETTKTNPRSASPPVVTKLVPKDQQQPSAFKLGTAKELQEKIDQHQKPGWKTGNGDNGDTARPQITMVKREEDVLELEPSSTK